jgi:hypothetical protein
MHHTLESLQTITRIKFEVRSLQLSSSSQVPMKLLYDSTPLCIETPQKRVRSFYNIVTHPEDLVMKAQQVKHQELVEETCELMT